MNTFHPLPVIVHGNIFQVDQAWYSEDSTVRKPRSFTLRVHNASGQWVDVVIDRNQSSMETGHMNHGGDGGFTEALQIYLNSQNKITRWRPGVFGIPGNGGGEVLFDIPATAIDTYIHLNVRG